MKNELDLSKTVPIFLHGDDAECHRRRSFLVCAWGSVLLHVNPWDSKLLIYAGSNSQCIDQTYNTLNAWIAWSLIELLTGEYLSTDPWGRALSLPGGRARSGPIAGGWRAILCVHKGDEKYIQKTYGMYTSWVSENVCWLCRASRKPGSEYMYTAHGLHAPHRSTMVSTDEFVQTVCRPNSFVCIPGFDVSLLAHDYLHVVDLAVIPDCEAVVLSKFLRMVSLRVAQQNPEDEHAAIRAAMFVGLVEMRDAISFHANHSGVLTDENVRRLQEGNYLFHASLNCC
ncbi:unnamed protein product [Effrenium voratum]|nr:unnamed protein product [Effrenium voratum]